MEPLPEGLFRESFGRIVARLTHILGSRHIDLAEECAQDALVKALRKWPLQGIPDQPEAWLMQTARRRAIDRLRRDKRQVAADLSEFSCVDSTTWIDEELGMVLLCCHPALSRESQVALVLKTVGGLGVREIARAYLVQESAIAQRLVRAKKQIREQDLRFDLPQAMADAAVRLDVVLEALYLLFNEGYTLCASEFSNEAVRLCRLIALRPATAFPKCHALLALMLLQSARDPARMDSGGALNLLEWQDRSLWDRARVAEGMRHLDLAANGDELTRYHLEAGIASLHVCAGSWESTDWRAIAQMYEALESLHPSPVVRLNHAIAIAQVRGPQAAIAWLEGFESRLDGFQTYHAVAGMFHQQAGQKTQAAQHYARAIFLARTPAERILLEDRAARL